MVNGILNVYKEKGYTSHDVVAKLRGIVGQKKMDIQARWTRMRKACFLFVWEEQQRYVICSRKRIKHTRRSCCLEKRPIPRIFQELC